MEAPAGSECGKNVEGLGIMKKIVSIAIALAALVAASAAPALAGAYDSQPGPGSGIESQR
jgi:hypothetical protein